MARGFDDASSQGLRVTSAVVSAYPCTMACWFNSDDDAHSGKIMEVSNTSTPAGDAWFMTAAGDVAGDPLRGYIRSATTIAFSVDTSTGFTAGTWHHACFVVTNSTSRTIYLDAGGAVTDSRASNFITGADVTLIGRREQVGAIPANSYFSGNLAEGAIWNVALTAAGVAILAKGYSPLLVRPQNLVAYWPMIRDTDDDIVGGFSMTPLNSPTIAAHPRVLYPIGPYMVPAAAAIAALRIPRHPAAYFGGPTIF